MAFIYKIKNNINNKCYVGKTEESIEKRFSQHISESKRERCKIDLYIEPLTNTVMKISLLN